MTVSVRQPAPDFHLSAVGGTKEELSLEDFRGQWLLLLWYPKDNTPVCGSELPAYSGRVGQFAGMKCAVVAASVQDVESKKAWFDELGQPDFPVMADPGGDVARAYGVLDPAAGISLRASFLIDPEGQVRWSVVHDFPIGRSVDESLRVLAALQSGGACLVDWQPEG